MTATRTFKSVPRHLPESSMFDRETWFVDAEPLTRTHPGGGRSVSIGFPVLAITACTGEPERIAELVAQLLTEHFAKEEKPQ